MLMLSALAALVLAPTATIKVFVVSYFPLMTEPGKTDQIDKTVTGGPDGPYEKLKLKTQILTKEACRLLEEGSKFRGYKNPNAIPALRYEVIGEVKFKEAIPKRPKVGDDAPLPDYNAIMKRVDAKTL